MTSARGTSAASATGSGPTAGRDRPNPRGYNRRGLAQPRAEGRAMPMHDWTRVEAGIFHAFHHRWISAISDVLNTGLLPGDYYALPEQQAAGFGPEVLTLQDQA